MIPHISGRSRWEPNQPESVSAQLTVDPTSVVDKIIVRYIWSMPPDKNLREKADAIADQMHEMFLTFVDFAGEFIWQYSAP
jgi:hypothetical protein